MYSDSLSQEEITAGFLDIQPFISFDLEGRITGTGEQGLFATLDFARKGRLIMPGKGHWTTHYVDLEAGEVRERSTFAGTPSYTELPVRTEAVVPDVPACLVRYAGPLTGSFEHPGGNLKVGFTVPGNYRIELEPFPYLPVAFNLKVTP